MGYSRQVIRVILFFSCFWTGNAVLKLGVEKVKLKHERRSETSQSVLPL